MSSNNNILIAQGGGPTNVINQSLAGIIINEKKKKSKIFGSINGVNGIINNNFITLNNILSKEITMLRNTPGAALGSTRDKPDQKYCEEIYHVLKKKKLINFITLVAMTHQIAFESFPNTPDKKATIFNVFMFPKQLTMI